MKKITVKNCANCPRIHPDDRTYCREMEQTVEPSIIHPDCPLDDDAPVQPTLSNRYPCNNCEHGNGSADLFEPNLNKWFADELERRWPNITAMENAFGYWGLNGVVEKLDWLKQQLLNPKP
jgi:hypothetical protein